jgi:hypothetical protein
VLQMKMFEMAAEAECCHRFWVLNEARWIAPFKFHSGLLKPGI